MRRWGVPLAALLLSAVAARAHALCIEGSTSACTVNGQAGIRVCEGGTWTACLDEDGIPIPVPPPLKPPFHTARTGTSITLKNANTRTGIYKLQRLTGSTWTQIATLPLGASFVNGGLALDSRHCYRFAVSGQGSTNQSCSYTTDGTGEKAWHIELELTTANVGDAGTNGAVSVGLRDNNTNFTWLDYGQVDFQRNTTYTYDLRSDAIDLVTDINQIKIHKYGTDGWCLAGLRLMVNSVDVYARSFADQASGCLWLDNGDGHAPQHIVSHATMRAHPSWQAYDEPTRFSYSGALPLLTATLTIPADELRRRVESLFGDGIHGTAAFWGGLHGPGYVEPSAGTTPGTVHFDLDLMADIDIDWLPNAELDVDFDLKFEPRCSPDGSRGEVVVTAENLVSDADFPWWVQLLGATTLCDVLTDCVTAAEHTIEDRFKKAFEEIELPEASASIPGGFRCLSANVEVATSGRVRLNFEIEALP